MLLDIYKLGDEVLRRKARPVVHCNQAIRTLLKNMAETMYAAPGVGLAAPQVGVTKRMVVVDDGTGLLELVNPEIVERSGSELDWEGCLSVPGLIGEVERAQRVRVKALDGNGKPIWIDAEDYLARIIQHELDHLDGVVFTDLAKTVRETPRPTPRVVFFGTPDFAVPSLAALLEADITVVGVVTQPDRPQGRGLTLQAPPVKELALEYGLPVLQPERIREPEAIEAIAALRPDCFVVVAYGQILPRTLLEMPRLGAYNVHASLLPKYRGAAPINWAIINGESETGVTVQHMVRKLDAGDIVAQMATPIGATETADELHDRLADLGAELIVPTLRQVFAGTATRTPQDPAQVSHVGMLSRELARIDWTRPAAELEPFVRGLNSWPVAHTVLDGVRLKVWRAELGTPDTAGSAPGTVAVTDESIAVATGAGWLKLLEVQAEGRARMSVGDYLRGHRVADGALAE